MKQHKQKYLWAIGATILLLLLAAGSGFAQTPPQWYSELNNFQNTISYQWRSRAFSIGLTIFGALATLDLVVLGIALIFSDKHVDPFNALLKRVIFIAFLFGILSLFWVLESVVVGFQEIAFRIYGYNWDLNEFVILNSGIDFFTTSQQTISDNAGWLNYISGSAAFDILFLLFVLAGFVILAIQYAYISLEVLIALTFSPLFLSFLPFRITRPYSERYISYIVHLAVKVFLFYMIFFFFWGVLNAIMNNILATKEFGWPTLLSLGFFAFLGVSVLAKIPGKMSQFVTENQGIDLGKFLNRIEEI